MAAPCPTNLVDAGDDYAQVLEWEKAELRRGQASGPWLADE
jgi:hypothetical protein